MNNFYDEDHGLPDGAFTEDELAAGVQHLARGHDRGYLDDHDDDFEDFEPDRVLILKHKNGLKVDDSRWINNIDSSKIKFRTDNDLYEDLVFDTFDEAKNYAINNPGTYFTCNKSCH